jgi:hypothetical protein
LPSASTVKPGSKLKPSSSPSKSPPSLILRWTELRCSSGKMNPPKSPPAPLSEVGIISPSADATSPFWVEALAAFDWGERKLEGMEDRLGEISRADRSRSSPGRKKSGMKAGSSWRMSWSGLNGISVAKLSWQASALTVPSQH